MKTNLASHENSYIFYLNKIILDLTKYIINISTPNTTFLFLIFSPFFFIKVDFTDDLFLRLGHNKIAKNFEYEKTFLFPRIISK